MPPSFFFVAATAALAAVAADATTCETVEDCSPERKDGTREHMQMSCVKDPQGFKASYCAIEYQGYAVDVACVQNTGSKSFDKGVSVLTQPGAHTKYCLMMGICIKDLVLLEAPTDGAKDHTIKYGLTAELLADVAGQIKASTLTAAIMGGAGCAACTQRAPAGRLYSEQCANAGGNAIKCARTAGCIKTKGPPDYILDSISSANTHCHLIDCAAQATCTDCAYKGCGWQQGKCQDVPGGSNQGANACPVAGVGCWTKPDPANPINGFCSDDSKAPIVSGAAAPAGGDTCTGARKYFDTVATCLGKAKDACPAADCEYKGRETGTRNGVKQYDDEKCNMGEKLSTVMKENKDVITFRVALMIREKKCSAAATEADCSTAGKNCGWKTDYDSDNIEQGGELDQKCDMAAAAYYDGCGSLKGKVMSLMSKDSREKAAKMQKKATAAKAKVAAAKAKLAALPATATAEEKAAVAKEVTAAEAEETKYVAAAASSETKAAANEKDAAENSTARALASCATAVLASLLAGLMAF